MRGSFSIVLSPAMRNPRPIIVSPGQLIFPLHKKPFFSSPSCSSFAIASLPHSLTPDPDASDTASRIFSIISQPNWQKSPALKSLVPSISPSHVSSLFALNMDPQTALNFSYWISRKPNFKHTVHSYFSLLNILINHRFFPAAYKIRLLMIKSCDSVEDTLFVLDLLRTMNKDDGGEHKFKLTVRCYNTLLMSLSRFGLVDEMKGVYFDMLDDMLSPNIYTFNTMVNAYCKQGNMIEAELYVSKIVQAGLSPDTFTYTSLILGHCRNQDVDTAYRIFKAMPQKGCRRNEVSYTNLIHGLCEAGRVDEAVELLSRMGDDYCYPTVRTYTVIICALCGLGRKLEALNFFKEMSQKGCEPNGHTYTVLIDSLCKESKLDDARRMLDVMLEKGLVPSVVTYNALIDGYCKEGLNEAALEILSLMESNNCVPNTRTYNELICGFCKRKNVQKAMALLNKMLERKLLPSVISYNLLIHGQCRAGHLDSAYRLLNLMNENGLVPDRWTYGIFIDSLCKSKRLEEARGMFDSLKEKGINTNEVIYTALIDGYCKAGKLDDAFSLLEKMQTEDCLPNACTYNALIDELCKERKVQEALLLMEKMVNMGVKPTVHTYTILIKEMLKEGDFDHAHRFLDEMVSLGHRPDVFTYTSFIHAYCSVGKLKEAEDMLAKMTEEGIAPDSLTYTLLINAYGHFGLIYSAFDVLKRMFDAGCEPSHHTFSFLITHLSKKKWMKENGDAVGLYLVSNAAFIDSADVWKLMEFDIVLEMFDKMLEHGCLPNVNTYGKLIIGLSKVGRLEVAQRLFNHMRERGISASEDIFNALLSCCCELQMYDKAVRLVDDMICHGHLPKLESCKLLVCGLYEEGDKGKANAVFCNLLRCGYHHDEVAWKILIDGLLKKGLSDTCSELLGVMEKEGCRFHPQTYTMLIEGLDGTTKFLCVHFPFWCHIELLYMQLPKDRKICWFAELSSGRWTRSRILSGKNMLAIVRVGFDPKCSDVVKHFDCLY